MMSDIAVLDYTAPFPSPEAALADPNGLLAIGGDLSVKRLTEAYQKGIFPWYSDGEPILWWSPDPRGVVFTNDYVGSKSLLKHIRRNTFTVTCNRAFDHVIQSCAHIKRKDNGTWISTPMVNAYQKLHRTGLAHSVEVWQDDRLIGGLYGVFINNIFCGESMFSAQSNGSKVAFHFLMEKLRMSGVELVDCQMQNSHLAKLGCQEISRRSFLALLQANSQRATHMDWSAQEWVLPL